MSYLTEWALGSAIALGSGLQPNANVEQILLTTQASVELCQSLRSDATFSLPVLVHSTSGDARIEHINSDELLRPGVTSRAGGVLEPIGWPADPAPNEPVVIFDLMRANSEAQPEQSAPMLRGRLTTVDAFGQYEQWWFGSECDVQRHHRMIREEGVDLAMQSFDADDRPLNLQLLNPMLPELGEGSSNSADSSQTIKVAMVDAGVNYLLPQINKRLARNSEGTILGYDFWDMDARPFDAHPARSPFYVQRHGTATASLLLSEADFVELVPYRYPRGNMQRMRDLIEHASNHGIRLVGLPLGGGRKEEWLTFEEVASEHPEILFVASAGNNGNNIDQQPVYPASLKLPNMIVVTSVDDFGRPAEGVNYGFDSVEYMLPAERQRVLQFDGQTSVASGSSYAVPRFLAIAAKFLQQNALQSTDELIKSIERRYADGLGIKYVNKGYIADPLALTAPPIPIVDDIKWEPDARAAIDAGDTLLLPIDVLIIDDDWGDARVTAALKVATDTLIQCGISINDVSIKRVQAPDYLRDLSGNESRTLMTALRRTGQHRRVTLVFARDTNMLAQYEGEAFGRGNTRNRPWLQDSVWLLKTITDDGVALAHELFHVLANSGEHLSTGGNLMSENTSENNTTLLPYQCEQARSNSVNNKLVSRALRQ